MTYICLGYIEPGKFENMSESERNTMLDECFSCNGGGGRLGLRPRGGRMRPPLRGGC
jgi:hypothetical protein